MTSQSTTPISADVMASQRKRLNRIKDAITLSALLAFCALVVLGIVEYFAGSVALAAICVIAGFTVMLIVLVIGIHLVDTKMANLELERHEVNDIVTSVHLCNDADEIRVGLESSTLHTIVGYTETRHRLLTLAMERQHPVQLVRRRTTKGYDHVYRGEKVRLARI